MSDFLSAILALVVLCGCAGSYKERQAPGFAPAALEGASLVVLPISVPSTEIEIPWPAREEASSRACAKGRRSRSDVRVLCYSQYATTHALPALDELVSDVAANGEPARAVLDRARQARSTSWCFLPSPRS